MLFTQSVIILIMKVSKIMRFIAEDNPKLYIDVENYRELKKKIKELGDPDYNYEVIFECSFQDPRIVGKIRAIKKQHEEMKYGKNN